MASYASLSACTRLAFKSLKSMIHVFSESISPSLPPNIKISFESIYVQPKAARGSAPATSIADQASAVGSYFSAIVLATVG